MERRKFIKDTCLVCASIIASGMVSPLFSACSPLTILKITPNEGKIVFSIDKFTDENKMIILKNFDALDFDIAVVKYDNSFYKAFELQCTHQPNVRLAATDTGFVCHEHGSRFNLNGQVTQAPARKPLKEFNLELINQHTIKITL